MRLIRMGAMTAMIAIATAAGTGCKSSMHDENLALHAQNRELQEQLRMREAERDSRPDASALAAKDATTPATSAPTSATPTT